MEPQEVPSVGAVHEATHVVVGLSQGLRLDWVALKGRGGGTMWRRHPQPVRALALMAWAPQAFEWTEEAVEGDRAWLVECARESSSDYVQRLRSEAINLYFEHLLAIAALAYELDRRGKMTGREVGRFLKNIRESSSRAEGNICDE